MTSEIKLTPKQEEILNIINDMGPMVKIDTVMYLANTTAQAVGRVCRPLSRMDLVLVEIDTIDDQWIYSIREEKRELVDKLLVDIRAREADILQKMEANLKQMRKAQ